MGVLDMKGIHKSFSGVTVLDGVDLHVEGGRVLALLGENGAGKSTLMKILTGVYTPTSGSIFVDEQQVHIKNVDSARRLGIGMIHQELNLFSNLSIAENFLIGNEARFQSYGMVDYKRLHAVVGKVLVSLRLERNPAEPLSNLSIGERQLVEIGKALQQDVRFLAMDEPTSALTPTETEKLFEIIKDLKEQGVGIIYISHRLEELFHVADDVTVLRDGKFIATRLLEETSENELVTLMVGRDIDERYPRIPSQPDNLVLETRNMTTSKIRDINITVRAGEIVGLGGLMGAGRTETARAIAGVDRIKSGEVSIKGKLVRFHTPSDAIKHGIAFVTEDRKDQGLVLPFSILENMSLPTLAKRSNFGIVRRKDERVFVYDLVNQLKVKFNSIYDPIQNLSGGNQQKVVIGKWLGYAPELFILDEPTRGVDVGAKQEIYQLMNRLKEGGMAVLMLSSDLPELLGMSDRVYVMHEGTVQGELTGEQMNEEAFMQLATGGEVAWGN
jgi:ribose transport system ATP-binding protein